MSMEHKGYAFDWLGFASELRPTLIKCLESNDIQGLLDFIEGNREELTDPYDGMPLKENWQRLLSNRDVHEYGDYAITKYYDVRAEMGMGSAWMEISDRLPVEAREALLGEILGPKKNPFDPGRMGSYFQIVSDSITSRPCYFVAWWKQRT